MTTRDVRGVFEESTHNVGIPDEVELHENV
jgi:hypothetical protein